LSQGLTDPKHSQ